MGDVCVVKCYYCFVIKEVCWKECNINSNVGYGEGYNKYIW